MKANIVRRSVAARGLGHRPLDAWRATERGAVPHSRRARPSRKSRLELPLELRNQVSRVSLANERSAGAVILLDAGSRWSRVGLFSGSESERDQPLLGPLYYVRRALAPYAELVEHQTANLAEGLDEDVEAPTRRCWS